jgi:hypothetical protein
MLEHRRTESPQYVILAPSEMATVPTAGLQINLSLDPETYGHPPRDEAATTDANFHPPAVNDAEGSFHIIGNTFTSASLPRP